MQMSPLKYLPILIAILALGGAAFVFSQKQAAKTKVQNVTSKLPEPTPFITVAPFRGEAASAVPTPIPTATPLPAASIETIQPVAQTKGGVTSASTRIETVCTPVYGMANSCAEHTVVDTGLETGAFSGLAIASYFGGLVAFIKAKRKA